MALTRPLVDIYTDGSCLGNPGVGGYGAILVFKGKEKETSGGAKETTNNRMELTALIEALKLLKKPCALAIHTDSKYLMNGITTWLKNWQKNGFRTAAEKDVLNKDLWEILDIALKPHTIKFEWIKGHSGHPMNERADLLARTAAEKLL